MKVALTNRRLSTHQLELLPLLNNKKQQDMFGNEMNKTFRNTGRNRPVVNFAFERTGDQHFLQGSTPITTPKQTINVAQMSFIEIFWCLALKSIFLFLFMAHSQCVQKLNKISRKLYLWIRTTNKCVWLQYAGLSGRHISSFWESLSQIKYEGDPSFSLTHRHRLQYFSSDLLAGKNIYEKWDKKTWNIKLVHFLKNLSRSLWHYLFRWTKMCVAYILVGGRYRGHRLGPPLAKWPPAKAIINPIRAS